MCVNVVFSPIIGQNAQKTHLLTPLVAENVTFTYAEICDFLTVYNLHLRLRLNIYMRIMRPKTARVCEKIPICEYCTDLIRICAVLF